MSKEYLEALNIIKFNPDDVDALQYLEAFKVVEQSLQRLKAIDNANPSEALDDLDNIVRGFNETTTGMYGLGEVVVGNELEQYYKNELETIKQALLKAQEDEKLLKSGDSSDGYHTFNQLYYQRCILFAALVRLNRNRSWKSYKHSDGELCFGGGWFIVGIDTPIGSYTYHYENKYWDLFECQELECGKEWDGHTEEDVTRLLSL